MKRKTKQEIASQFTRQEFFDYIMEKDKIQGRQKTAEELGCTKYVIRECLREMGFVFPIGKRLRTAD